MFLTKKGVTFDVSHPAEIARLKKLGYEEKQREASKPEDPKPVTTGKGKKE